MPENRLLERALAAGHDRVLRFRPEPGPHPSLTKVDADERNVFHDGLRPESTHPTNLDLAGGREPISLLLPATGAIRAVH